MRQFATYEVASANIVSFDSALAPPDLSHNPLLAVGEYFDFVPLPGQLYIWTTNGPAPYINSVADNRRVKSEQAAAYFSGLFYLPKGFAFAGVLHQIDPGQSQPRITAKGAQAALSIAGVPGTPTWDPNFYWIAADNSHVAMTATHMYAFAMAVNSYATACILQFAAIKQAIASAPDQTALDAIDVTTGYPGATA